MGGGNYVELYMEFFEPHILSLIFFLISLAVCSAAST